MFSLVMTIMILIAVFFVQHSHPFLAGILAVTPVKIVATTMITLEAGGVERLHEAISGMLIGQLVWSGVLLAAWLSLR